MHKKGRKKGLNGDSGRNIRTWTGRRRVERQQRVGIALSVSVSVLQPLGRNVVVGRHHCVRVCVRTCVYTRASHQQQSVFGGKWPPPTDFDQSATSFLSSFARGVQSPVGSEARAVRIRFFLRQPIVFERIIFGHSENGTTYDGYDWPKSKRRWLRRKTMRRTGREVSGRAGHQRHLVSKLKTKLVVDSVLAHLWTSTRFWRYY